MFVLLLVGSLSVRLKGRHRRGSAPLFITVRIVAYVGCEPVSSTVLYIAVQTNVARYAFVLLLPYRST